MPYFNIFGVEKDMRKYLSEKIKFSEKEITRKENRSGSDLPIDISGCMEITLKNQGFLVVLYLYVGEAYN